MKIVGPSDSGKTALVEELAGRLAATGRVGTVKHLRCDPDLDTAGRDTARHRRAGAAVTYGLQDDGSWFATGTERDLDAVVRDLAPRCDYLLVEGYSDVSLPTVALAGREHAGERVLAAPDADAVDDGVVLAALRAREPIETPEALARRVIGSPAAQRPGAVATVTGRVQPCDGTGESVVASSKSEGDADADVGALDAIEARLGARDGVRRAAVHHRTELLGAGEALVHLAVLADTRAQAFAAVEAATDRLQTAVSLSERAVTVEDAGRVRDRSQ